MPERIGILGGTFDPIHLGHLRIAEEAVELLDLDRLIFMPAASPPHKSGKSILDFQYRWRMIELSIASNVRFRLSDLERRLPGKSYTVITLRTLHEELAEGTELYFLVGLDAFMELDTWWHHEELFRLARLAVLRRPGFDEAQVGSFLTTKVSPLYMADKAADRYVHPELLPVYHLQNTHLGVSSTGIRQLASTGRSIRYLVVDEVMSYITEKKLYLPEDSNT